MRSSNFVWALVFLFSNAATARVKRESTLGSQPPQWSSGMVECLSNEDCAVDRACVSQRCEDPCLTFCGNNTYCHMSKHFPMCFCYPGYIGNPFEECQKPGIVECIGNQDCPTNTTCVSNRCKDPCPTACGNNSVCQTTNHITVCSCMSGYTGNAIEGCHNQDYPCIKNDTAVISVVNKKKKYVVETSAKLTWTEALKYCQRQNGSLATITSREENDEIVLLIKQAAQSRQNYYIGGTDSVTEGHWTWIHTGQPIEGYTNWYNGQPNNLGNEDCLVYWSHTALVQWWDNACSDKIYFICEY